MEGVTRETGRVLDKSETAGCLPHGWYIWTDGGYFEAFYGNEIKTGYKTTLRAACEAAMRLAAPAAAYKPKLRDIPAQLDLFK